MRINEELKQVLREFMEVSQRLLRIDSGIQCREGIEEKSMNAYEAMKDGAVFPSIETLFDDQNNWVVDGFHCMAAIDFCSFEF